MAWQMLYCYGTCTSRDACLVITNAPNVLICPDCFISGVCSNSRYTLFAINACPHLHSGPVRACQEVSRVVHEGNDTSALVSALQPFTRYSYQVSAKNSVGSVNSSNSAVYMTPAAGLWNSFVLVAVSDIIRALGELDCKSYIHLIVDSLSKFCLKT